MPISATLGVSLVGRRDERRAGWEEHQENPADWGFLLSWASHKTSAWFEANRSRSLTPPPHSFHPHDKIPFSWIEAITTHARGSSSSIASFQTNHPHSSQQFLLFDLVSIQFYWTGAKALLITYCVSDLLVHNTDCFFLFPWSVKFTLQSFWPVILLSSHLFDPLLYCTHACLKHGGDDVW